MKTGKLLIILLALIVMLCISVTLIITKDSASIGIIGGADGPTAIFVTAKPSPLSIITVITIIIVIAVAIFLLLRRKR